MVILFFPFTYFPLLVLDVVRSEMNPTFDGSKPCHLPIYVVHVDCAERYPYYAVMYSCNPRIGEDALLLRILHHYFLLAPGFDFFVLARFFLSVVHAPNPDDVLSVRPVNIYMCLIKVNSLSLKQATTGCPLLSINNPTPISAPPLPSPIRSIDCFAVRALESAG